MLCNFCMIGSLHIMNRLDYLNSGQIKYFNTMMENKVYDGFPSVFRSSDPKLIDVGIESMNNQ